MGDYNGGIVVVEKLEQDTGEQSDWAKQEEYFNLPREAEEVLHEPGEVWRMTKSLLGRRGRLEKKWDK